MRIPGAYPCLALLAAVLAAGCASSDLSGDAATEREVAIALPPGTPAAEQTVRAVWFPSTDGYRTVALGAVHVSGVLVLAGDRLWFMTWNDPEHHFDRVRDIGILDSERIASDHMGTSAMLVVQSANDIYDSFQLMGRGGLVSDPALTDSLAERLRQMRAKAPPET